MTIQSWDYLNAIRIADPLSYVNVELLEGENEFGIVDPEYSQLSSERSLNPEKEMIKKESYYNLSEEAKQIVSIIVNAPSEILEMMTPKTGNVTLRMVSKFISNQFFNRKVPERKTKRVIKELKGFVKNLED